MKFRRRVYSVAHSRDGFRLIAMDEHIAYTLAEKLMDGFLSVLGDPCCGEGPLAKIDIKYSTLRRFGIRISAFEDLDGEDPTYEFDPDEGIADVFWFRAMNLPQKLYYLNRRVAEIPLTDEQAETLHPDVRNWFTFGPVDEEDTEVYTDCCMTGQTLGRGWHSYGCENFQGDSLSALEK